MDERLARALAALTTGIYVLTVRDGVATHGMSSSWVTQVSGDPPLLMVAIDRGHLTHAMLEHAGVFALNVVGRRSRHLEDYFYSAASRRADNLDPVAHEIHSSGPPILTDAAASLICRVEAQHTAGDHSLFVARVEDVVLRADDRPLTSQDLEYVYVGTVVKR